jgi:hypothetical protein
VDTLIEKAFQRAEHPFRSRVRWAIGLDACRQEGTRPGLRQRSSSASRRYSPLEILVAERGGAVVLAYSESVFVAERHGNLEGNAQRLRMMATALGALSAAASGA